MKKYSFGTWCVLAIVTSIFIYLTIYGAVQNNKSFTYGFATLAIIFIMVQESMNFKEAKTNNGHDWLNNLEKRSNYYLSRLLFSLSFLCIAGLLFGSLFMSNELILSIFSLVSLVLASIFGCLGSELNSKEKEIYNKNKINYELDLTASQGCQLSNIKL